MCWVIPPCSPAGHVRRAKRVEKAGLAVVDVTHDRHDRRAGEEMIVDVLVGEEAGLDVAFRNAPHRVTELGGHQFGGVGVDHVGDLEHHALADEELDDLHARARPSGPARSWTVMTSGITTSRAVLRAFLAATLALLTLTLARPAHRGQRAHALDGALVVSGHGLDRQAAFAAARLALGARNRLAAGAGLALARVFLIEVRAAVETEGAGTRSLTRGALDLGRPVGSGGRAAGSGTDRAGTRRAVARRPRRERRISNRFSRARGPLPTARRGAAVRGCFRPRRRRAFAGARRALVVGHVGGGRSGR